MIKNKPAQAIKYFKNGYNCAQSVLLVFAKDLKTDIDTIEKIALGFGGGMGRLQKTCGAVTGAFMVIGLYCHDLSEDVKKQESRRLIQDFHTQFTQIHGTSECRALLGYDTNTEMGQVKVTELNLSETVCEICIIDAVNILESLFGDR